ncbi:MAG: AbrB/MazE/SpoVT family DNA-binding domain-containing protein [Bacteroidota bacterium]
MQAVKVGASRQVAIPKKIHDALHLQTGDYLEVELIKGKLVLTPKTLVDRHLEERLSEALEDVRQGRVYGPFQSVEETVRSLRASSRKSKKI